MSIADSFDTELVELLASPQSIGRGQTYAADGRVTITTLSDTELQADVRGYDPLSSPPVDRGWSPPLALRLPGRAQRRILQAQCRRTGHGRGCKGEACRNLRGGGLRRWRHLDTG
ncbi:MAG: hypothetical protein OEV40_20525, partial [Acidimicrobiia bacterium]|nr:hypothetical protein [Acidimicrobiia bacterium]